MSGERGCLYGNAATPTQKSPEDADQPDELVGVLDALGVLDPLPHRVAGRVAAQREHVAHAGGGEPADERCAARRMEWSTAVKWATGVRVVSVAIRSTMSTVRSRVPPPAPYVTETKVGRSGSSSRIACQRLRAPSSVFGGKNSNENDRLARGEELADRRAAGADVRRRIRHGYRPAAPSDKRDARHSSRRCLRSEDLVSSHVGHGRSAEDTSTACSTSRIREEVDEALPASSTGSAAALRTISDDLGPAAARWTRLLGGGKRLRPAFCYWGWRAAGGETPPAILAAAASLELLQASALIHDDVMDSSDTRRGQPAVHRRFEALHRAQSGWRGDAERVRLGRRDPARRPVPDLVATRCSTTQRAADRRAGGARRAVFDADAHRGDVRPVPRPAGAGARRGDRRPSGAAVLRYKSGEVHDRAARCTSAPRWPAPART